MLLLHKIEVGGPCTASSAGGIGGGTGFSLSGGGGSLNQSLKSRGVSSLNGSRGNIAHSSTGGMGVQGPGRPVSLMLQQGVNLSSSAYSPLGDILAMISSRGIA